MPLVLVNEIDIDFPFEPYKCQLEYMYKVIECLRNGKNGILESPTGTGKTLCLLCATLAWQDHMKQRSNSSVEEVVINHNSNQQKTFWNKATYDSFQETVVKMIPKIIYSSRTHSQLNQCMNALKRTSYANRKVGLIASRDQLCIHPKVNNLESNSCKIYACKSRVKHRSCHYYNALESSKESITENLKILDIEDLVSIGKEKSICPYFLSREMLDNADITFMPYNYLLDSRIRRLYQIDLDNAVIIFDEAHNIEQVCEDSASAELTSVNLATSIEELKALGHHLAQNKMPDMAQTIEDGEAGMANSSKPPALVDVLLLKSNLVKLEVEFQGSLVESSNEDINIGITRPVEYLYNVLDKCGFHYLNKSKFIDLIDEAVSYISMNNSNSPVLAAVGIRGLEAVVSFLRTVFFDDLDSRDNLYQKLAACYRIYIQDKEINLGSTGLKNKFNWMKTDGPTVDRNRVLSYWCFSPGRTMSQLIRSGVRSIIFTSGTLYPIDRMKMEMNIKIEVELRNRHIINSDQMLVSVCTRGPDGEPLNSSYETREKLAYVNSLGNAIVNLARVIPRGLLVVFPSYGLMKKCVDRWESCDIYNSISVYKQVILEPQEKIKFAMAMDQFQKKNDDLSCSKGAILLAVARGKISEGLDLADHHGRGVIVVGLPYPAMMEPRIRLKMSFLDDRLGMAQVGISGRTWYRQQAYRSVNQSVGRVIRHSRDFGAVFLFDERFASSDSRTQMPLWMQPNISICNSFNDVVTRTKTFFQTTPLKYPPLLTQRKNEIANTNGNSNKNSLLIDKSILRHEKNTKISLNINVPYSSEVFSFSPSLKNPSDEIAKSFKINKELSQQKSIRRNQKSENFSLMEFLKKTESLSFGTEILSRLKKNSEYSDENILGHSHHFENVQPFRVKKYKSVQAIETEKEPVYGEYFSTIKKLFADDHAGFQSYKTAIKIFKADCNVEIFFSCLSSLFCKKDQPSLVAEFYNFIKPECQDQFENLCKNVLGLGCRREKKSSLINMDNENKNSLLNCARCLASPALWPLSAPCKHICCFRCWKIIIEGETSTKRCPGCQTIVRRSSLTRIKPTN